MHPSSEAPNKTRNYFKNLCKIVYLIGGENYWWEDLGVSTSVKWFNFVFKNTVTLTSITLILLQWGVYFFRQNLTDKQMFDAKMFALAHPLSFGTVLITEKKKEDIGKLIKRLIVKIKQTYNDETVEDAMITRTTFVLKCYCLMMFMTCFLYGVDGYIQVRRGDTFVTIVTAWPKIEDWSILASIGRIGVFIVWSFLLLRLITVFIIVIPLTICLSHQFITLRSYFENLNSIFEENGSQAEKESKYEKEFIVGIQLHSETLECVNLLQQLFGAMFGGQIIIKSTGLMALMGSMAKAERTLSHVATTVVTASYTLISLGYIVWNAGNITVEASYLPSAIFSSGWHNCTKKKTRRIRPLVISAILMSQAPVEIKCLGSVTLSYRSYFAIVKSCYSGFSVLY